jgi:hypothetical protein
MEGSKFSSELQGKPLITSDSKALRGFQHIDLAVHLCPLKLKAHFEHDPMYASCESFFHANELFSRDFMNQVEDGTIEITADDLPSFLYETETDYNPDDEVNGLFRGFLLVRVSLDLVCL